jgi:Flp pilus assembly protein TadD
VFYPFDLSLPLWKVLISAIILIIITATVFYLIRKLPFLFTGWFLYLGTLIPVIGLVQVGDQSMSDRYTYLPSVGIIIMLSWGIPLMFTREKIRKKILFPTAIVIIILMMILTWRQCGYWKNSITISSHALKVTINNYKMHHNMGTSLFKEGKLGEAIHQFSEAIKINPNYLSYNSRGEIYARAGKYQQAFDDFNKAISLNPQHPDGYYNRGVTYDVTGQSQPALADFNKAISLDSNHVNAYNSRGIVFAKLNRFQEAIEDFTTIIAISPDYVHAYSNRAKVYSKLGQQELAAKDYNEAMRLNNKR